MIFCEDCRLKKKWPCSPGFPLVGTAQNSKCEVCGKLGDAHDFPASMLIPEAERTKEQKHIVKMMQDAYKLKAESLMVVHVSGSRAGKINHEKNNLMHEIFVKVNDGVDWYTTYLLRLKAQEGYQQIENIKRDRRDYAI